MLFKLSNLNSNLAQTLGYLNPALNNSAPEESLILSLKNSLMIMNTYSWVYALFWTVEWKSINK